MPTRINLAEGVEVYFLKSDFSTLELLPLQSCKNSASILMRLCNIYLPNSTPRIETHFFFFAEVPHAFVGQLHHLCNHVVMLSDPRKIICCLI